MPRRQHTNDEFAPSKPKRQGRAAAPSDAPPPEPHKLTALEAALDFCRRLDEEDAKRPVERDYDLDDCPLCGGKAVMDERGNPYYPQYSGMCVKCGCTTQGYSSKYWAAWRWNTRKGKVEGVAPSAAFPSLVAESPDASRPSRRKARRKGDLEGQMTFDDIFDFSPQQQGATWER